jgi:hypothetical protein
MSKTEVHARQKKGGDLGLDDLPPELIDHIIGLVPPFQRVVCLHVSRLWRSLVSARRRGRHDARPSHPRESSNTRRDPDFIAGAIRGDAWHLIEWARGEGCPWGETAAAAAIEAGHAHRLASMADSGCPVPLGPCALAAARNRDASTIRWLIEARNMSRHEREHALADAAGTGDVGAVEFLCEHDFGCASERCWVRPLVRMKCGGDNKIRGGQCLCYQMAPRNAAYGGHNDMLEWLDDRGCKFDDWVVVNAAEGGHIRTLQWLWDRGTAFGWEACAGAAEGGQLDALVWLRERDCDWNESTCLHAAYYGHLHVLRWAMANGCEWDPLATTFAAIGGHLDVADWCLAQGCEFITDTHWETATYPDVCSHPSLLALMIDSDTPPGLAARSGRIDVLEWMLAHGSPIDASVYTHAAETGHFHVIDWALAHGEPWDAFVCAWLAEHGLLDALKYVRAKGCPWDEHTCAGAASRGHLEVLEWAQTNGCPWDERTCDRAAEGGHLEVLRWARANGCPWESETMCLAAASHASAEMMQWLVEQGCAWDDRIPLRIVSYQGKVDLLAWIVERGYPCDLRACLEEAERKGLERFVEWITEHRAAAT